MTVYEMDACTRVSDLIVNRLMCIDYLLGAPKGLGLGYCSVRRVGLDNVAFFCDCEVARWRTWDIDALDAAFSRVEMLEDALWCGLRLHAISTDYGKAETFVGALCPSPLPAI